jgi:hypothetical protein
MSIVIRLYVHRNGDVYLVAVKNITVFSLLLDMKRKLEAKVKADVKVYLIPKDQLEYDENGKPKLKKEWLVFESKNKKGG